MPITEIQVENEKETKVSSDKKRVDRFVYVEMHDGKGTKFMTDVPITVVGKLGVGKENLFGSLYSMEAEKVDVFKGF